MPLLEFLYPSCGGMIPPTPEEQAWMDMERAAKERKVHPLMDQHIEPHPLPDRIGVAWIIFSAWSRMIEFEGRVEATGKTLEAIGLVTANRKDMGVRTYELERNFFEVFGIWAPGKALKERMYEIQKLHEKKPFWSKTRPNPFSEFCEVLYEVRAHTLDNPLLYIAERCGGDPLETDG